MTENKKQLKPNNQNKKAKDANTKTQPSKEVGGQKGPEPTRYGDWEKNGRISDF